MIDNSSFILFLFLLCCCVDRIILIAATLCVKTLRGKQKYRSTISPLSLPILLISILDHCPLSYCSVLCSYHRLRHVEHAGSR